MTETERRLNGSNIYADCLRLLSSGYIILLSCLYIEDKARRWKGGLYWRCYWLGLVVTNTITIVVLNLSILVIVLLYLVLVLVKMNLLQLVTLPRSACDWDNCRQHCSNLPHHHQHNHHNHNHHQLMGKCYICYVCNNNVIYVRIWEYFIH